jgi:hypothetical protein
LRVESRGKTCKRFAQRAFARSVSIRHACVTIGAAVTTSIGDAGLFLLEHAQQLRLKRGRHVANLIETIVGIYALLSFMVTRRTREIGVRVALGATNTQVPKRITGGAMLSLAIVTTLRAAPVPRGVCYVRNPGSERRRHERPIQRSDRERPVKGGCGHQAANLRKRNRPCPERREGSARARRGVAHRHVDEFPRRPGDRRERETRPEEILRVRASDGGIESTPGVDELAIEPESRSTGDPGLFGRAGGAHLYSD